MLTINSISLGDDLGFQFNTRGNARGNSIRRPAAFVCNFCDTQREWLSCSWYKFQCCLLVSWIMFFPQLLSRYKRIEVIIKIKANFYKEIAQFTILVAIIGNKISKYYFLTCLSQIPYISTRQTYTGKFNSRDSAWYDLFSFSDTSSSQIITKTVARTIETSWQYTCLILDFQKSPSSDFIWRGPRGRLVASLVWSGKLTSGQVKCSHRSEEK